VWLIVSSQHKHITIRAYIHTFGKVASKEFPHFFRVRGEITPRRANAVIPHQFHSREFVEVQVPDGTPRRSGCRDIYRCTANTNACSVVPSPEASARYSSGTSAHGSSCGCSRNHPHFLPTSNDFGMERIYLLMDSRIRPELVSFASVAISDGTPKFFTSRCWVRIYKAIYGSPLFYLRNVVCVILYERRVLSKLQVGTINQSINRLLLVVVTSPLFVRN
jgi:hypothetical protein